VTGADVSSDTPVRVFRVTVRGQFHALSDSARTFLISSLPEHDIFLAAFTEEGTFTYDSSLVAFNLRYEIRCRSGEESATTHAQNEAERFLRIMGLTYRHLRAKAMDMTAMGERLV
jgi:hypothetical protein